MRILKTFAKLIVFLALLNFVAFSVLHVATHGNMFGGASGLILDFASFPRLVKEVAASLTAPVKHYQLSVDRHFEATNKLENDIFSLESYYSKDASHLEIRLVNLRTSEVIHRWLHKRQKSVIDGVVSNHPVLLNDYSVIFNLERTLYRIDANSNLIWKNSTLNFHHTIEFDHEGNIWCPATVPNGNRDVNSELTVFGNNLEFRDNLIVKLKPKTGEVLYSKPVSEILLENNYTGLVYGFWQYDLIHLNDIQPVYDNAHFWKQGDLFLSCRNIHTVFLYRPSSGKILWLRTGLWSSQHDVDVLDSTSISIFDNNVNTNFYDQLRWINKGGSKEVIRKVSDPVSLSVIAKYDFATDSLSYIAKGLILREKIGTRSQGIFSALPNNMYFIEETDQGKIFIGNDQETVFKKQFVSEDSSFVYYPGWTRIYEKIPPKQ